MAAPRENGNWRSFLRHHKLFKQITKSATKTPDRPECSNILAVNDGILFAWNAENQCLSSTNLAALNSAAAGLDQSRASSCDQTGDWLSTGCGKSSVQHLLCTNIPVCEVEEIAFSRMGHLVALVGTTGIFVLELPRRWGKFGEFEGGKEKIICRTIPIAERFLMSNGKLHVLQVSWHPGSDTDTCLTVLTSDNTLRLYSVNTSDITDMLNSRVCVSDAADQVVEWPVYLLYGNGDVFSLPTSLTASDSGQQMKGPLTMKPAAEDNYGVDACSILCLASSPPVLAIATCAGRLYHCVVLDSESDDDPETLSTRSAYSDDEQQEVSEAALYVYESVELELSLTTVSIATADTVADDFTCPIMLYRDPGTASRYFCVHSAGVHCVVMPWVETLASVLDKGGSTSQDQECYVEHLICTKPLPNSPVSPVRGITVVTDPVLGFTLLCLLASYECVALPLRSAAHIVTATPLLSSTTSELPPSPLRHLHGHGFDGHIRRLLQRSTSTPMLRGAASDLSPADCYRLLSRTTQVFREEYLLKHQQVMDEIDRRVRSLVEQKQQQLADLQAVDDSKVALQCNAEALAEKYDDINYSMSEIVTRAEQVLRALQSRMPVLSDAERAMAKELGEIKQKLSVFKTSLNQVEKKAEYHRNQTRRISRRDGEQILTKNQKEQIGGILQNESTEISNLVLQVDMMKQTMNL
ncbi:PREDICTED: nuclear pore complex protein Nup88-like [Priapulus caudatus]|uniref:Nuclear pore complex protein Nup88-like n=1 Tax=Priapulus caudatus TaxID=37621 RepID=A0ABM1DY53_PRICU|nr:PREDICTED: nuclear pore complex protein Nup88-like [Priapulus caudatus]